ncbi:HxlR family transcriptional regulator [Nitrospirillum amazonense]|uniref:HxlR family transcriptional regulator n=2 Tax=Nitrospirillum amazonense TaxID=28077 RepID=A0A560FB23_9PROT|nr:HxlR family transcriptional regulator [Nitrospirillum amazonense]
MRRPMPVNGFSSGLDAALFVLGGKWKPLILFHLFKNSPLRYAELRRAVGRVSDKVLIQQIKEMLADGIIDRRDFGEIPPRVEYSATQLGKSLGAALMPLCKWGEEFTDRVEVIRDRRDLRDMSD